MTDRHADFRRCEHVTATSGFAAYLLLERKAPAAMIGVRLCTACAQRVATTLDEQGYLPIDRQSCE